MPGLFDTYEVRGVTLPNRVVLAPMAQWSAEADGRAKRWHRGHYGTRAVGGPGLVMMEGANVDPTARGGLDNLGIWEDAQIAPLAEIVDFCHEQDVKMGIQDAPADAAEAAPADSVEDALADSAEAAPADSAKAASADAVEDAGSGLDVDPNSQS